MRFVEGGGVHKVAQPLGGSVQGATWRCRSQQAYLHASQSFSTPPHLCSAPTHCVQGSAAQRAVSAGVLSLLQLLGGLATDVHSRQELLKLGTADAAKQLLGGWRDVQVWGHPGLWPGVDMDSCMRGDLCLSRPGRRGGLRAATGATLK